MLLAVKKRPLDADWERTAPCGKKSGGYSELWSGGPFRGRRFCGRQRSIFASENFLPDVFPCFHLRWFCAYMGRLFSGGVVRTRACLKTTILYAKC